ncbi:MAG: CDP-diacylglycerol--glycerol-3-phosphate 3-phosphatidyltransferase [Alphaproteobacteria bacterium]|nr:CDP-diacylglycerol--glycerol-3-phosphate 3-phosphatidyltransferase [Alphaproteobacteria bacterium]
MLFSAPNLLTLSRIAIIPLLVAAFYLPGEIAHWATAGLFAAAGITDYFDGRIARGRSLQSSLGAFLDPIADKLLVASALVMMVAERWIDGAAVIAALIIVLREILVSGLREFLGQSRIELPVSRLGKWKTAAQMVAIGALLLGEAIAPLPAALVGQVAIWLAAALTLATGYDYLRVGLRHLRGGQIAAQ